MIRLISSALLLLLASCSLALEQDWQQPVTILSDHAELDRKTGMVMYEGNVTLTQGTLRIEAEQLLLFRNGELLERVTARGTPARYEQIISTGDTPTRARGERIDYLAQKREILIEGGARLEQDGNLFSGEQIRYDMLRDTISAQGGEKTPGDDGSQRIKVVIQPQTSTATDSSATENSTAAPEASDDTSANSEPQQAPAPATAPTTDVDSINENPES
ncbi:lipopolysaccharide transport periplasmic protein LptA [Bacterioplanes sanyensis]|uniref:Lipopolysaccharide export system protein LptA n=1 Tax=Bacterioplanes sanyensis TaxID=1249553 RepID=A0A222FI72_9GAMM|nr:lipopolysaccharide transport periplasmic protein LptA [Bacterioplanes sanyensis]ASP38745.1 lipopolysaccharide transport periplasmic protein LptA [Bacterioplanes sanyensis]